MNSYSSYKDSGVEWNGEIPSHWDFVRLKYLFSLEGGKDSKSIQLEDGQYPILGTGGEISRGSDFLYDKPTLLLGRKGTIDKPFLYNEPFWVSDVMYYTIQKKDVTPKYLYLLFTLIPFDYYRYGSTQPSMSRLDYESMYFPVPPLQERQKVIKYLDTKTQKIDELIEKTEQKIELLKEKRTSLINHCVTKGLNPNVEIKDSGVEWIGEIPSHWDRIKLGWISEKIGDGLHSTPKYVDLSDYYFINGNNLVNGKIKIFESTKSVSEEEYNKHFIQLDEKTILLSINGTIGNLSFYDNEKVILGKSSCYINLNKDINQHFIYYVLRCKSIVNYFTFELTGTTIFNLSLNSVRNTPIVFPPNEEQTKIVEYLDEQTQKIDSTIEKETQRIELLKEYRQSLISEVVTGKIDVMEWNG